MTHRQAVARGKPLSDEMLLRLYERPVQEFPMLLKMHSGVVLSGGLHRAKPRSLLFEAAKKLGPILTIWIEGDKDTVEQTLRERERIYGVSADVSRRLRENMKKELEKFEEPTLIFRNTGSNTSDFCNLIQKKIESMRTTSF